ncbi:ubiquitin domain-containing protein 2 isoform X1 [Acanthopagrus latus]|uniref:ubiquitin domain-containing protein 2 isoform X1 n=1 Tax=Acanthopagrus latus TaxID=8177 RepID=UPI00187BE995|nr:ubiquitin domain-containing protein 2 isoform X1 [Acanthopagrus latus]
MGGGFLRAFCMLSWLEVSLSLSLPLFFNIRARQTEPETRHPSPPPLLCPGTVLLTAGLGGRNDGSCVLSNPGNIDVALGRNQPLKRERPKWKSDYPMTEGQLRSKRDEFWDTAPAFEGRKEIWDALRAAASAFESNDHLLAQAILDGASITLPHGALTECYDELGNRYQLPVYCLSPPVNMIEERSEELDGSDPDSGAADPSSGSASDPASGGECQLRLRLSTGRDLRLAVRSTDTVGMMKRRLQSHEGVPAATQRWFFSGRPLTDRLRLDQLNISRDYVVQVILSQPPPPEPVSTPGHTPEASGPVTVEAVAALPQEPMPVEN